MSGAEGLADLATGAVAGRAVEPDTGIDESGHTAERSCLNCGTSLNGDYCHACGQRAHVHRSLGAFGHDLLHGVFHFEGKIWRTLPMLAWRPGELTRRYIDGQRASFVSPIALFLFCVFLMFAVLSLVGSPIKSGLDPNSLRSAQTDIGDALTKQRAELAELNQRRARQVRQGRTERVAAIDREIADARKAVLVLEGLSTAGTGEPTITAPTGSGWLNEAYLKAKQNPSLLLYKVKTNAYKFSWMLIPLSVPFLWLLFPFSRRFRFYDHTVFVTYSLCFMTLLSIVALLLIAAGLGSLATVLWLVPPVHMYRQLRGTYQLRRRSALWRTVVLVHVTFVTTTLFLLILLTLGVLD